MSLDTPLDMSPTMLEDEEEGRKGVLAQKEEEEEDLHLEPANKTV